MRKLPNGGRVALLAAIALAGSALEAEPLSGGPYILVGAISAGGGTCSGGSFSISGWVASAGAGTSTGDTFDLTCGLLGFYAQPGDGVALKAAVRPDGRVRIWWAADLTGFVLESSNTVEPGAFWETVSPTDGNEYLASPSQPARFFRLRQQ